MKTKSNSPYQKQDCLIGINHESEEIKDDITFSECMLGLVLVTTADRNGHIWLRLGIRKTLKKQTKEYIHQWP